MSEQLSPEQAELYRRVDEVLHYLWDPIGVSAVPEARDEYQSYVPHVFSLLIHQKPHTEIVAFLVETETKAMGFSNRRTAQDRAESITTILTNHREAIQDHHHA